MRASMYHNVFPTNTTSLKWNPPLQKSNLSQMLHLPFQKERTCFQWILHYLKSNTPFYWWFVFINRDFLQEQNACPAKSCYNIWKEYDFISSEIACVSKMPCILQVFVCNPLLPARSIVFYQVGMRFCMFTLKETTNTTSLKWIVIFPRKVTCFNCFSGMLTIETKCIYCLSNAAPFEWECLFDKHAPVNQFFSRGERCSFHHPFKKSMFSLIFSGLRKAPNVETFSWELNQSNLLKGQSRWMHFQRNAFRMQFSSI